MRLGDLVRGARLHEGDIAACWEALFLQRLAHRADGRFCDRPEFLRNRLATTRIGRALPGRIGLGCIDGAVRLQYHAALLDRAQHRDVADATLPRIGAD